VRRVNSLSILEQAWAVERCWGCTQSCYERNDVCLIGLLVRRRSLAEQFIMSRGSEVEG
jgi:hypothetical protein